MTHFFENLKKIYIPRGSFGDATAGSPAIASWSVAASSHCVRIANAALDIGGEVVRRARAHRG
jgi:hypothetical protein